MEGDSYEVLFDDGFVKILKHHKLAKIKSTDKTHIHIAPLFDPVIGSKEDRRERKRKINVAELFGIHKKKHKEESSFKTADIHEEEKPATHDTNSSGHCEGEEWTCRWLNGEPVGIESVLDNVEGPRRSIIVPDHRLPTGWEKHLTQRIYGTSAGKWDTVLVNAEGRKFHNRQAVKQWLEENKLDYHIDRFDFCLHLNRARKLGLYEVTNTEPLVPTILKSVSTKAASGTKSKGVAKTHKVLASKSSSSISVDAMDEDTDNAGGLKIIMENNSYKCPIQGCGKNFRKENLAQMHIKHYHPEYTKFIGSTPNVADLAYARTVGEHIDDIIVPKQKPVNIAVDKEKTVKLEISPKQKSVLKTLPPKEVKHKIEEVNSKNDNTPANDEKVYTPVTKDSEIIRLLNSEPKTKIVEEELQSVRPLDSDCASHSGAQNMETLAAVKYPEIKLTDLLNKAEPVPVKKDEPRTGIKTLLPVIRSVQEIIVQEPVKDVDNITSSVPKLFGKSKLCRKRQLSENELTFKCETDEMSDYCDGENKSGDSFSNKSMELPPAVAVGESPEIIIEGGEVIRLVHMRSEEIINCTCGITEEDGLMIQCELCLCWQHAHCNNIEKENEVPEKYICKICKNPERMRASMKYFHDQEWLKQGKLATSTYHARNEQCLNEKYEKLRKTHELSGCLIELMEFIHNLKIKLNIADIKDHPKLYLWANVWNKTKEFHNLLKPDSDKSSPLMECMDVDMKSVLNNKSTNSSKDLKIETQSELISILEDNDLETGDLVVKDEIQDNVSPKSDINSVSTDNEADMLSSMAGDLQLSANQGNISGLSSLAQLHELSSMHSKVPQPEAPINSTDCRMHLLDHVSYFQNLVEQRLDLIEADIKDLEECDYTTEPEENTDMHHEMKQPLQMLIRDLTTKLTFRIADFSTTVKIKKKSVMWFDCIIKFM
ncbi:MBD-R2 [Carabus blaptoides fortunei]